jgi:hypothetical protein
MGEIDAKFEGIYARFRSIDTKFDAMESKIESINSKIETIKWSAWSLPIVITALMALFTLLLKFTVKI